MIELSASEANGPSELDLMRANTKKIKLLEACMLFKTRPRDKR